MNIEIERKFLVHKAIWEKTKEISRIKANHIIQAYIVKNDKCIVRIRLTDSQAFLTLKSRRENISCQEYEYEIPISDAKIMLENFVEDSYIEKLRYLIEFDKHTWEVDEFLGQNQGLIVAEIELDSEDEVFLKPDWVDKEVSKLSKYFNAALTTNPYNKW